MMVLQNADKESVMAETEQKSESSKPATPQGARRCRIPRLNRSSSVRLKCESVDGLKSEGRPKSLVLTPSRMRDYTWHMESRYRDRGSLSSMPYHMMDDDRSSVKSFGSFMSYTSFDVASQSQGTEVSVTRPVSRTHCKKYVLHCDRHLAPQEEYLTPTQRKEKEIRQLKSALVRKTRLCDEKDAEIERLKNELERLHEALTEVTNEKNDLMHSSQESDQMESLEAKNSASEISFRSHDTDKSDMQSALHNEDSGISLSLSPNSSALDDLDASIGGKVSTSEKAVCTDSFGIDCPLIDIIPSLKKTENLVQSLEHSQNNYTESPVRESLNEKTEKDSLKQEIIDEAASKRLSEECENFLSGYQKELEQLKAQHKEHYQDLKEKFNDRVNDLLQKLTEANSRYLELRPLFDRAQEKIHSLENQLSEVQRDVEAQEEWHNQMYLKMYRKGQEAARFEAADDVVDFTPRTSKRASVPDLLRQLHQLEDELEQTKQLYREATRGMGDRQAEYTLRFLKDAVFYFLTKKDKEHLKAIQSILGFTDAERMAVAKAMKHRRL